MIVMFVVFVTLVVFVMFVVFVVLVMLMTCTDRLAVIVPFGLLLCVDRAIAAALLPLNSALLSDPNLFVAGTIFSTRFGNFTAECHPTRATDRCTNLAAICGIGATANAIPRTATE